MTVTCLHLFNIVFSSFVQPLHDSFLIGQSLLFIHYTVPFHIWICSSVTFLPVHALPCALLNKNPWLLWRQQWSFNVSRACPCTVFQEINPASSSCATSHCASYFLLLTLFLILSRALRIVPVLLLTQCCGMHEHRNECPHSICKCRALGSGECSSSQSIKLSEVSHVWSHSTTPCTPTLAPPHETQMTITTKLQNLHLCPSSTSSGTSANCAEMLSIMLAYSPLSGHV